MTTFKALLCVSLVLIISQQIVAQHASGWQFPSFASFGSGNFDGIQLPSIPGTNSSGLFGFPFSFPFPGLFGQTNFTLFRQKRQVPSFPSIPTLTTCDYSEQPRFTCASCTQSLLCLRNNVGVLTNCSGIFGHCNNGFCSPIQSSECSS